MLTKDQERLYAETLKSLELLIMICPSSPARNHLCDANIHVMRSQELQVAYPQLPASNHSLDLDGVAS